MPDAGEDHGQTQAVGGFDDLLVADRAAGLNDGGGAGSGDLFDSVGKGEKGVGGGDCASSGSTASCAPMLQESTRLIWPAPTPTVCPSRRRRWHWISRACRPSRRRAERVFLSAVGERLVTTFEIGIRGAAQVGILQQNSAGDIFQNVHFCRTVGVISTSRRFFLAENLPVPPRQTTGRRLLRETAWPFLRRPQHRSVRLTPMTPPKAETGSHARALLVGFEPESEPVAAPAGLVCLMMAANGLIEFLRQGPRRLADRRCCCRKVLCLAVGVALATPAPEPSEYMAAFWCGFSP